MSRDGIADLRADLSVIHRELASRVILDANKDVSQRVLPKGRQAISQQPHRAASEIAATAKAKATIRAASIRVTHILAASLEFGRSYHQLWGRTVPVSALSQPIWLSHSGEGHAVRPAVKRMFDSGELDGLYADASVKAFKRHGWS